MINFFWPLPLPATYAIFHTLFFFSGSKKLTRYSVPSNRIIEREREKNTARVSYFATRVSNTGLADFLPWVRSVPRDRVRGSSYIDTKFHQINECMVKIFLLSSIKIGNDENLKQQSELAKFA